MCFNCTKYQIYLLNVYFLYVKNLRKINSKNNRFK